MRLSIKTDQPEATIELIDDGQVIAKYSWQAHRMLGVTLHHKIKELLDTQGVQLSELDSVAVLKGHGSFTGLRIGVSVANALGYGLDIPVIGLLVEEWETRMTTAPPDKFSAVFPEYGTDPQITQQKK
jgi:tRNA threonylcarbamoyladenosine biosynthesis protein TsaB